MRAQITLIPSESKRLIAKGVAVLPSIQNALENHDIFGRGTTNGFLAEELLGVTIKTKIYTAGIVTGGETSVSNEELRIPPYVIKNGKAIEGDFSWQAYLNEIKPGDVFIKVVMPLTTGLAECWLLTIWVAQ